MRRSARTSGTLYPSPFQEFINSIDKYARSCNLKPHVVVTPLEKNEIEGLRLRLIRNRSFVKTRDNPDPAPFPSAYQSTQIITGPEQKIESLLRAFQEESPPSFLVLLLQPPESQDYMFCDPKVDEDVEMNDCARPLCGIMVRMGPTKPEDIIIEEEEKQSSNKLETTTTFSLERSIIGGFCRRAVPEDVAEELLTINLVRAIIEAICYEEVTSKNHRKNHHQIANDGSPERGETLGEINAREKRFMAMNVSELPLCPDIMIKILIEKLKFLVHWDCVINDEKKPFVHDEGGRRECPCIKRYRKDANEAADFYQFMTLNCKRLKGVLQKLFENVIKPEPSPAVRRFCIRNSSECEKKRKGQSNNNNNLNNNSMDENEVTPSTKRRMIAA